MTNHAVDDLLLPFCLAVVAGSLVALALLSRPTSWLSRWVDRKIDNATTLPQDVTR